MANRLDMASSSQPPKQYDVFISFRGEDTRSNFTSHLYEALRKKIETYIDYRLEKGEEVWPSLVKAIEDSTLFLVIFSESYAHSTWCLKELSKILECFKSQPHHLVIPVFYRVDPSHVRKQSGSYQKAFAKHENNKSINKQELQKWREALTHAANLCGWHCSSHSNEADLITEIVQHVEHKLSLRYQSGENLKGLIGIHRRMADVESLLYKDSDGVRCVAIWGMGGLGKTTLARALFDRFCSVYDGVCFLYNVAEESKKNRIYALQKKLMLELLGDKEFKSMLAAMRTLRRKRIFIVLDDVDDPAQLENLAGRHDWFGSGSKILITTRDKQAVLGKEVDDIYRVEALNPNEAFDLFSIQAFRNDCADPRIREMAEKVTQYADGNPLALKVLGSLLNGKNHEAWESQLKRLQKFPCKGINDILKLSFEGLEDDEEKNIFLHIVCLFNQYDVKDVTNLLDACGYETIMGLERLKDKALLDIHKGRLCMHHLIKEMGREIVRKKSYPQVRVLIWNSNDMGSEAIEGIILDESEVLEEMCLSPQVFSSMPKLRFLIFHDDLRENKLKFPDGIEFLPNKLILLCWRGYPSKSFPPTFTGEHLVEIKMCNSKLTKLWDGDLNLVSLRKMDLRGSKDLIELPNFTKAIHLAYVYLEGCSKLRSVDPSILSLHSLCGLYLRKCKALTSLTSNIHLKSLVELNLSGCSRLSKFSVTSEQRQFQLDISGTAIHDELCSSSGRLSRIDSLWMDGCKSVPSLYKLFDLRDLRRLRANGCNTIASNLHSILEEMRDLEDLWLGGCSELFEVPENISMLSSLYELDLSGSNIETLPSSITHLSSLHHLYLDGCKRLQSLPQLPPSVALLSVEDCVSLETLHLSHSHNEFNKSYAHFSFMNCLKLDGQSIKAAEVKVLLKINEEQYYEEMRLEYPGERVPQWFMYRSNQSSPIVELPSSSQPSDGAFIFCAIISKSTLAELIYLEASCFIDGQHASTSQVELYGPILSDHVILWSDENSCQVQWEIEEKKIEAQGNTFYPWLRIQFTLSSRTRSSVEIKECGVWQTSALEYQIYIQQLQLALQWRRHLENANIAALMSLENWIPSLKVMMTLKNLILSFKAIMSLKNLIRSFKAMRNLKNLIMSLKALMCLKNLIQCLKALNNLKNLILCLEALMNLKNWILNLKNLTDFKRSDKFKEYDSESESFDERCVDGKLISSLQLDESFLEEFRSSLEFDALLPPTSSF